MNDEDFGTVIITYARTTDKELNDKLDKSSADHGGQFKSHKEDSQREYCTRQYIFVDEDRGDLFIEQANFIISRHFPFEPIDVEDFPVRAQWGFDEAVYHHVEFETLGTAQKFATWMRAALSTYLEVEMFDIFILNPVVEDGGPVVVYAFPFPSVLSEETLYSEADSEINDILSSVNVKKNDNGGMLN